LVLTFLYDYVAEYRDFLAHLRGLRFREGEQVKKYLKSPEGSRPKGHVTPMDRERKIKTYKGAVVKWKAINRDFHSSRLASGNLSEDNMVRGRVETIIEELDQIEPPPFDYGRTTDFQSPQNYNSSSNGGQNRVVSFGDSSNSLIPPKYNSSSNGGQNRVVSFGDSSNSLIPPNYNSSSNGGQNRVVSFGDSSSNGLNQMNFDNGPYRAYFNSGYNNGKY